MADIDFDIMHWQKRLKTAGTAKEAKQLNGRIRKTYARKAAHKVLGLRLRWVPFLYAIMWRRIYHSSEAVSATINATEAIGENKFLFSQLGKLKTSTCTLYESSWRSRQAENPAYGERGEYGKDGLPKKEDSKSGAHSKAPRTTRR